MSNHFNAKAFESIDQITSALLAAHEELPYDLVRCGHLIHRAADAFLEAVYLFNHCSVEMAQDEFRRCKRSLKTALELLTAASIADRSHLADDGAVPTLDEWCEDDGDIAHVQRVCVRHYCD